MIITLTPNTGIDHTVQVQSFRLNQTIRAADSAWGMAGKAADVSWILGKLGVHTHALGFAAGVTGQRMEAMLRERGVETDFTWVNGESRLNTVLVVPGEGQATITSSSLDVSPEHIIDIMDRYEKALVDATVVVMGGSLPQGVPVDFFARAIERAQVHHVPVIFDSSGPALLAGVKSRPNLIKPNVTELEDLVGSLPKSQANMPLALGKLRTDLGVDVIATLGEEGAIASFKEGSYFIQPLSIPVVSAAGAGDGVLAGMALSYANGETHEYGLRHGFALAGAILKTLATADYRVKEYEELLPQICIVPL